MHNDQEGAKKKALEAAYMHEYIEHAANGGNGKAKMKGSGA
jgi:hypothetical protein